MVKSIIIHTQASTMVTLVPTLTVIFIVILSSFSQAVSDGIESFSSSFDTDLATLQTQIGYKFTNVHLLHRAMTHASFSQENNKALSILGAHVIEASVSLRLLSRDINVSSKVMSRLIAEVSSVNTSCALDGNQLGLHKIIRVSPKTDALNPAILCGGFRAMFGAIAIDAGLVDDAVKVFWRVHGDRFGRVVYM